MAVYKRGGVWWYSFIYAGKRVQESAKTSRKTLAAGAERGRRLELERALSGLPTEARERRIRSVGEVLDSYAADYGLNHRQKSAVWVKGCAAHLKKHLEPLLLPDVTEEVLRGFIRTRLAEKACGRTINMDLGTLSRAIGKKWGVLWPNLRKLEERKDAGRALSPDEEKRLLAAIPKLRSALVGTFVRVALMTGMRFGEIVSLTWGQVDLSVRVITVGRAKTSSGTGRQIPMNQDLFKVLSIHAAWFTKRFKVTNQTDYLFPWGSPFPTDPTCPTTTVKRGWESLREAAGVSCRLHDLRHTAATKMAEAGVPESTMLALMGHTSRAMLERYSHIRMAAKREAVESLSTAAKPAKTNVPSTIPTTVDVSKKVH
jgi:integrase